MNRWRRSSRWTGIGRATGWVLLALSLVVPLQASERVALVIGNGDYQHTVPLNNPPNDAREVAAALERLGFAVTRVDDADKPGLERQLAAFRHKSRNAELALLYYAGHAIQVEGRNYLVPVDAEVKELGDISLNLVALGAALQQLQGDVNVVILDACRDNPFERELSRSAAQLGRNLGATRGLGREETLLGGGTYLMMAAAPDAVAQDGPPGGHSPYTAALLQHIETPDLDLRFLHARVRQTVEQSTRRAQSPEAIDRLPPRPIHLAGLAVESVIELPSPPGMTSVPPAVVSPEVLELEFWRSIQGSANAADFEAYLEQYPRGNFAALARSRIAALRVEPAVRPEPSPPPVAAPPSEPAQARLSVKATPTNARIRIMNIVPAYREGMALDPGRYDIEVSARGYQTQRRWYELSAGDRVIEVALERLPERPAVTTAATPAPSAAAAPSGAAAGTAPRDRLRDGSMGPEMVLIRGGSFTMGSPASESGRHSDERQHRVNVGDVWIGKYAVTFEEYDRFARATGRDLPGDEGWGRGRRPVINVSWHDATAYAEWLSGETGQRYRLPTEAEWEYACRGGQQQRYCGSDNVDVVAWYSGNSGRKTQPVGGKQANRFGLYDMSGNVMEWTCSGFDANYAGAEQRCDASAEHRVLRGGSWYHFPDWVRSALRFIGPPGSRGDIRGFRLARSP